MKQNWPWIELLKVEDGYVGIHYTILLLYTLERFHKTKYIKKIRDKTNWKQNRERDKTMETQIWRNHTKLKGKEHRYTETEIIENTAKFLKKGTYGIETW